MNATSFLDDRTLSLILQLLSYVTSQNGQSNPEDQGSFIQEVGPDNKRAFRAGVPSWVTAQSRLQIAPLPDDHLRSLSALSDKEQFLRLLQPVLIPRVSGTPGNTQVQNVRKIEDSDYVNASVEMLKQPTDVKIVFFTKSYNITSLVF